MFTVFGSQLGPRQAVVATEFPLTTDLAGTRVRISQPGAAEVRGLPLFAFDGQINAIMPSDAPLGPATLVISFDDADGRSDSPPIEIEVVEAAFGIFTASSTGKGPAIAQTVFDESNRPLTTTLAAVAPGQAVILWGTGLGAIPAPDDRPPLDVGGVVDLQFASEVAVFVGGVQATTVFYAGRSAEFAGVDQLAFEIPPNAPTGCYVPVWVRTKGGRVSNTATLSITAGGGACDDDLNPYLGPSVGDRSGAVLLTRLFDDVGAGRRTDTASAVFQNLVNRAFFFNPALSLTPRGTCLIYTGQNDAAAAPGNQPGLPSLPPAAPIDAGLQLILRGPGGSRGLTRTDPGFYESLLEGEYLAPGSYSADGEAGAAAGGFQATVEMPAPPDWQLAGSGALIERALGATVTWTPGPSGMLARLMVISASTANPGNRTYGTLVCTADAEAGTIQVPADAMANLPQSAGSGPSSTAVLYFGFVTAVSPFQASGLDYGFMRAAALRGRLVDVR